MQVNRGLDLDVPLSENRLLCTRSKIKRIIVDEAFVPRLDRRLGFSTEVAQALDLHPSHRFPKMIKIHCRSDRQARGLIVSDSRSTKRIDNGHSHVIVQLIGGLYCSSRSL